ncbi:MAG TPA: hypothetical protein VLF39_02355 [Candidatus Saccharimonadales bacterium]|nr:hypothetical protein [Candidatus Saccharimonadales bacterium]
MKIFITIFSTSFISLLLLGSTASAQGIYSSGTVGVDISWPNCSVKKPTGIAFGVVGVTNGLGYSTSPCLAKEASYFSSLSLYVNTGWNSSSSNVNASSPHVCASGDNNCLAYNYGYNAGLYAYNASANAGVRSSTWWLDVETQNTWSNDPIQNQNSLQGETDALKNSGVTTVGIYSTTVQWQTITDSWKNNLPNWGATTWTTAKQAAKYCTGHDFTGGGTWLIQFKGKLDQDYAC